MATELSNLFIIVSSETSEFHLTLVNLITI